MLTLKSDHGCTEAILFESCPQEKFFHIADLMTDFFKISFINKLDDFDSLYWDFKYKGYRLILHYNIYNGISIYPSCPEDAVERENKAVEELAYKIEEKLKAA
jgi:hypothetical protein